MILLCLYSTHISNAIYIIIILCCSFGPYFDYGILMPYWKELGEAMLKGDNVASSFHLKDIKLTKPIMDLLAPGLM